MKAKLEIQQFIAQHQDWEKILVEKPYSLSISRDKMHGRNLVMFKYSQIDSDFNLELVRECRGLILDEDTFEVVCYPFKKFGNYGESYCPSIDWKSCWVGEKIDGSLIKVVKIDGKLLVSTNGTIDAYKAPLAEQIGCSSKSFGELFELAVQNAQFEYNEYSKAHKLACFDWVLTPMQWLSSLLKEGHTYMFELTSPWNKIVIQWHEVKTFFLGSRDNITFQESYFINHALSSMFSTPAVFPLKTIDECVEAAKKLDCNAEGYVVCDKNFNRVKVKSPTYVALHHMKNNGVLSYERGIEIVRGNELEEVLSYFPEFKDHLLKIKARYDKMLSDLSKLDELIIEWKKNNGYDKAPWLIENGGKDRKKLAEFLFKNSKFANVGFAIVDGRVKTSADWLESMPSSKLISALGLKEQK